MHKQMRQGLVYKVMHMGTDFYRIAAVIDPAEVVYSSNLHILAGIYHTREEARSALEQINKATSSTE